MTSQASPGAQQPSNRQDAPQSSPLPAEHIRSPVESQPWSTNASPPSSLQTDLSSRLKSVSVDYPPRPSSSRHRANTSTVPVSRPSPEPLETQDAFPQETDYLTALAAQERKVLELKDELRKAEQDLTGLKKQWAQHETSNRRNANKRLHQMRPMSVSTTTVVKQDDVDGSSAWMYEEMARRKALLGNGHARTASRRVFSGSRHTKTLSLIPATKEEGDSSSTHSDEDLDTGARRNHFGRVATTPDLSAPAHDKSSGSRSPQREVMDAGKQLATDWRDGLWTFFEDLKHATVGEDVRNQQPSGWPGLSRRGSTAEALRRTKRPVARSAGVNQTGFLKDIKPHDDATPLDAGSSFWMDHGLDPPKDLDNPAITKSAKQHTPLKNLPRSQDVDDDSWETWGSPSPSHKQSSPRTSGDNSASQSTSSSSPTISSPATSLEATPRASMGSAPHPARNRDSIPWPTLNKLGPAHLRRTASHLMEEWEKSLTPSSEDEAKSRKAFEIHEDHPAEHELISQMR